jgi:DMSO/TMAO reductase YedYZ molybdopterin-dependent catalytic subunit
LNRTLTIVCLVLCLSGAAPFAQDKQDKEVTEYQGQKLTAVENQGLTTVERPPVADPAIYRLRIEGHVTTPASLTYGEVLAMNPVSRAVHLNCVDGWGFSALWTGVRLSDLLAKVQPKPGAKTVIFYALGGIYSSALPLEFVIQNDLILAYKDNNLTLTPARGFPFKLVAEGKYGYKWVQWVERIEVSDKDYRGYWETRGYSNEADVKKR